MQKRLKKSVVIIILLIALPIGYTLWDMRLARHMAADVCGKAKKGMILEDYLSTLPRKEYRVIVNDRECILVPRRGLGRYHCVISHDGPVITGAKTGFLD